MNELELLRRVQDLERNAERQQSHSHGAGATSGWIVIAEAWTRTANTTFTAVGDVTALFPVGAKIKVTDTTTKYFYVVSAAYTTLTTVTITGGSDYVLAADPSARWISYQSTPQGFPEAFNFTTVLSCASGTFTTASAGMKFVINGRNCFVYGTAIITTNGTAVGVILSLPVNPSHVAIIVGREEGVTGYLLQGFVYSQAIHFYTYANANINGDGRTIYYNGAFEI